MRRRLVLKNALPLVSKTKVHVILKNGKSELRLDSCLAATLWSGPKGKYQEKMKSGLTDLEAIDFTQNDKRNPCKSLEKKTLDLEKHGKRAWGAIPFR